MKGIIIYHIWFVNTFFALIFNSLFRRPQSLKNCLRVPLRYTDRESHRTDYPVPVDWTGLPKAPQHPLFSIFLADNPLLLRVFSAAPGKIPSSPFFRIPFFHNPEPLRLDSNRAPLSDVSQRPLCAGAMPANPCPQALFPRFSHAAALTQGRLLQPPPSIPCSSVAGRMPAGPVRCGRRRCALQPRPPPPPQLFRRGDRRLWG